MELVNEEFMGSNDLSQKVKGKRTKRQRSLSPYKAMMTTSSSSSCCSGSSGGEEIVAEKFGSTFSPTTTSSDYIYNKSTEEEEDMANCLILLAQGDAPRQVETTSFSKTSASMKIEKFTPQKFSGFYAYNCKTCNRSFPSFQALGGHRASHKKPKPRNIEEKKPSPSLPSVVASMNDITLVDSSLNKSSCLPRSDLITLQIATNNINPQKGHSQGNNINKVNKVHECSICGSEFSSGQALGGHMRRHRANTGNSNQVAIEANTTTKILAMNDQDQEMIKPRNVLPLDLNLPAPEDDHYHDHHRELKFGLASTQQGLVLSAPALVDCHY